MSFPNIKYYYQANSGSHIARNLGLSYANGEYIQCLDADDILSEDKIEVQVKALMDAPNKVAVCRTRTFENIGELAHLTESNELDTEKLFSTDEPIDFLLNLYGINGSPGMVQPNAFLVPKSIMLEVGGWSADLVRSPDDDSEFFCRVLLNSNGIIYVPNGINYYRKLKGSITLSKQRSYVAAEAALKTIEAKTKHLILKRPTQDVKLMMSRHFAEFMYQYYAVYPDLAKRAEANIYSMGIPKIPLTGGARFKKLSGMIGFCNALTLKKYLKFT